MQFHNKLIPGTLIQRYKRFLADVRLYDGQIITAHCPNPGAMLGLKAPNSRIWLSQALNAHARKYPYTWELIEVNEALVGINTTHPNTIVAEALANRKIPALAAYKQIQREIKYADNCRIDFYLTGNGQAPCYLEVKNVHLERNGFAEFPDCKTQRGVKHLQALTQMVNQGARAMILYVIQRQDCEGFKIASDIDRQYDAYHRIAVEKGVEQLCYQCAISTDEITLNNRVQIFN